MYLQRPKPVLIARSYTRRVVLQPAGRNSRCNSRMRSRHASHRDRVAVIHGVMFSQ